MSGIRPIHRRVDHSRSRCGQGDARDLAGTGSRHDRSTVSMETMDTEDQSHMQGGPSAYARRVRHLSGVARLRPGSGGSTGAILVSSNRSATIELCDS